MAKFSNLGYTSGMALEPLGQTQRDLLQALLRNKQGLTVDALTERLGVSRNAVRQHLTALERVGWVEKGARRPSGGRPEQLYVLSETGLELFPRQYSWLSELLLQLLRSEGEREDFLDQLAALGRSVGTGLRGQMSRDASPSQRVAGVTEKMVELGYDATTVAAAKRPTIEAQNCVFHQIAMKSPDICRFDLAMLEAGTGMKVEHTSCMARGETKCSFVFEQAKAKA